MSALALYNLTMTSEVVGLALAFCFNCVIMLLLVHRSSPSLGSYKYLMMMYAMVELAYSLIGFSASSGAHSTDSAYVVFRIYNGPNRTIAPFFLLQYCGSIFVLLLVLAVHFIYRYFAVCNSEKMYLFQGHRVVLWVLSAILVGLLCPVLKYIFLGEHTSATEHLRKEMKRAYNLSMESIVYNGAFFRMCDTKGGCETPLAVWVTVSIIVVSLIGCFVLMTSFGVLTYSTLKKSSGAISAKTLQMQKQLLVALLIQGGIPIVFMYIPITVLWVSPAFGYGFGAYGNITMICVAIYPPLDQLATMYIIKDFRLAIKKVLGFQEEVSGNNSSQIGIVRTDHSLVPSTSKHF